MMPLSLTLGLSLSAACGNSTGTSTGGTGAKTGSASQAGSGGASTGAGGATNSCAATSVASSKDISDCKTKAAAQPNQCPVVYDCACDNCACKLGDCEADPDCLAILTCAQQTGCVGVTCYLPPGPCKTVIDMHGGPSGPGGSLATSLSGCITGAMCMTVCPGDAGTDTGDGGSDMGDAGDAGTG
jgi:hypothetical protein